MNKYIGKRKNTMKINEIVTEDASVGTASGNIASVSFPMTPGTTKKQQRQAVDPFGYTVNKKGKKQKSLFAGYTQPVDNTGKVIKR